MPSASTTAASAGALSDRQLRRQGLRAAHARRQIPNERDAVLARAKAVLERRVLERFPDEAAATLDIARSPEHGLAERPLIARSELVETESVPFARPRHARRLLVVEAHDLELARGR